MNDLDNEQEEMTLKRSHKTVRSLMFVQEFWLQWGRNKFSESIQR